MRISARSGAIRWLFLLMMVALLSGCASAGSSTSTGSSTTAAAVSAPPASYQSSSSATASPAPRKASLGPLQTVEHYWHAIASQNFKAAYRELAHGSVSQGETTFVSQEQQARIESATFSGSLTSASKTAAIVAVDSLTTTDGQYGCRTWSGSYQLTNLGGRWQIARASISPSPCQGSPGGTSPSSTAAQGNTGNTGNTLVIKPGRSFEQLAKNRIESVFPRYWGLRHERFVASPAFDGKVMFLRGERFLYALSGQ